MQSPVNKKLSLSNQFDNTSASFTLSPATLKAADSQTAVSQLFTSLNHLPRVLFPQVPNALHSRGNIHPSPALAALLAQRNNMLFSYNPYNRFIYPGRIS
jgi:hypothetical protein